MSFARFVAIRYLKTSRENRFFSWISLLSVMGLAIGVAALIVVLSVIDGFEYELKSRFLYANAHVMAYRYPGGLAEPDKWNRRIMKEFRQDVSAISPFIFYETMAKKNSLTQGVIVKGITPKLREKVQPIKELITPIGALDILQREQEAIQRGRPTAGPPEIILGVGLLGVLDAKVGDIVHLIPPIEGGDAKFEAFKVVGIYNSGLNTMTTAW